MNLEFHGAPATENENLLFKVNAVSAKLGLAELYTADLEFIHRLLATPGRIPGIIVRFTKSQTKGNEWERELVSKYLRMVSIFMTT